MQTLQAAFKRFTKNYIGQIVFVLLIFALCRTVAISVFYYGFLQTFEKASHIFFEKTPSVLAHIPFYDSSVLISSLQHPFFIITLIIFFVPFYLNRKRETFKYTSTRLVVFVSALMLAWELSTYDYNYYLDKAFYFDRFILLAFAVLILFYPPLTIFFVAFAFVYRSQFNFPVAGFELHDKRLLFDILLMFVAYIYARLFVEEFKIPFVYFVITIVASNYFMSGSEKIIMSPHGYEWLLNNHPADLFNNVHLRGWMAKASEPTISGIVFFLEHYGRIFQELVLVIELAALFLLRSRKTAIVVLISLCCMHVGIFVFGSMLFWKWIIIDLVLAFILLRNKEENMAIIFSKPYFIVSLLVILVSGLWLRPIMIGWHDTPFNQYFTYEVEDADGKVYQLDKNGMNPYHQWFQYDHFLFLVNKKCLAVTGFGYSNKYKVAAKIKETKPEDYLALEEKFGKSSYDSLQKQKYDAFIKTYFKNKNQRLSQVFFPNYFAAPNHLYSSVAKNEYLNQKPVRLFRAIFNQVYTVNHKAVNINKQIVDEIIIPE